MTDWPLQIPIAELRRLLEVVLHHVEVTAGDVVAVDKDYFWSIPPDELYDVPNQPTDLTIGQVSECWENLQLLLADNDRALAYDLVWLAEVLRTIGHTYPG